MRKRISIERPAMNRNEDAAKQGRWADLEPPVRVDYGDDPTCYKHCYGVKIDGETRVVYSPGQRHYHGALIWVETDDAVELVTDVSAAVPDDYKGEIGGGDE